MAEFKYEVVAEYAVQKNVTTDPIRVRSVSYNDREPKFDIRRWTEDKGKERMGKGITLTMEDLVWLAETIPSVVAMFTGKKAETKKTTKAEPKEEPEEEPVLKVEEDTEEEPVEETSKAIELMNYVIGLEKKKEPDLKQLHGAMIADGKTIGTNRDFAVILNGEFEIDKVDTIPSLVTQLDVITSNTEVKGLSIGEINKFKAAYKTLKKNEKAFYNFGEGKPTVDARYLGKSLEALEKGKIRYAKNGIMTVSNDEATTVIMPVKKAGTKEGLIKA